jgi:hypothetical protein
MAGLAGRGYGRVGGLRGQGDIVAGLDDVTARLAGVAGASSNRGPVPVGGELIPASWWFGRGGASGGLSVMRQLR